MRLAAVVLFCAGLAVAETFGDRPPLRIGSTISGFISVCGSRESAEAVLEADLKGGWDAGIAQFNALENCGSFDFDSFVIGPVGREFKLPRATYHVVEISDPTRRELKLYWLTSFRIVPPGTPA